MINKGEIVLTDCNLLITRLYKFTKPIFTKKGFGGFILLIISSLWILIKDASWFRFYSLNFFQFLILIFLGDGLLIIGTIVHEFLHSLMIKKYGGIIGAIGWKLFPIPSGFCDISDICYINGRIARFSIYMIGVYFWIIISLFFALLCKFSSPYWQGIFFYLAGYGIIATLVVSNPFTPSDGREAIREFCKKS